VALAVRRGMTRQAASLVGVIVLIGGCAGGPSEDVEARQETTVDALSAVTSITDEEATASTSRGDCQMKAGDLILHRSQSEQAAAIAYITESPLTHIGIVFKIQGAWNVYEAVGPVKLTPLDAWIARGQERRFATSRYRTPLTATMGKALFEAGKPFYGRPYDFLFTEDDASIYCSELVLKMYTNASASPGPFARLWQRVDSLAGWDTFEADLQSPADSSGEKLMKRIMAARGVQVAEFARQVLVAPVTLSSADASGGVFEAQCAFATH
jgi:hypothetical protein